jgi:DNA-3-methyladenine glycosylase II
MNRRPYGDVTAQSSGPVKRVDERTLPDACAALAAAEPALAALWERNGTPPLWRRDPGFPTLVRLILEQQVSLASGRAAFERLAAVLGPVTPGPFLALADDQLRAVGFSRQKARYVRLLATAVDDGSFSFDTVAGLDDGAASMALLGLTGVGPWTAANYLLFAEQRADVWPRGDRALVVSLGRAIGSAEPPGYDEADAMAEGWRPWRAVAARLLWHDYLGGPGYDPAEFS